MMQCDLINEDLVVELFVIIFVCFFVDQFENVYNIGYIYVGGLMNSLCYVIYDLVFFMYYCWIDYFWW